MRQVVELVIERLGGRGDGIAVHPDGRRLFVDGALAGERVRVQAPEGRRGGDEHWDLLEVLKPSDKRVDPPCPHATACGGCRLQHLALPAYADFVADKIRSALSTRGLDPALVAPTDLSPPHSRRRIRLAWQRTASGMLLGMRQARSRRIVNLATCLIARPELVALLPALRLVLGRLDSASGEAALDHTPSGIDVLLLGERPPSPNDRTRLAQALADLPGVCRISWRAARERQSETLVSLGEPLLQRGPARVALAPGGFRQATREGETAMLAFLNRHLQGARQVADLFGGTGALGLGLDPLPARLQIVESDPGAVDATSKALAAGIKGTKASVLRRDLEKDPLRLPELRGTDAVILDPPRAGARSQCMVLATSRIPQIGYVSCDPGSFARDARILVDGGYRLMAVQPIGQFLWSDEVELASYFRHEAA
ncbi:class I SAM-dependent RNA methyltransferase [Geminicoccus roseus]|uniref:class I SAM-dependent RNA methyltransferase n=1 Tax=Geminicoccus roseus TaxID=404900 RepID=UPI00040693D3|nr:class I SAM-dependent RNA methyltransferase [Geminicoccus roseus]